MAYNELALLVDVNGRPIPQYYDIVNDEFKPLGTMPMQDVAVKAELELLKAELATIKANQTSGDQKVTLSGSLVQKADVISTDTVIAAGADTILNFQTIASRRIAAGIRLEAARKWQVSVLSYATSDSTNYVKEQIILDSAASVTIMGAAQVDAYTNKIRLRVYNKDTQDMTVKLLSFAEVH